MARRSTFARRRPVEVPEDLPVWDGELEDDLRLDEVAVEGAWPEASLDGVEVVRGRLRGVQLTGATLDQLVLRDVVVSDAELSGATLGSAVLDRVRFERCRMAGLVASGLRATDVEMVDCQLTGAWFRGATLERCELSGCDLREADLYAARITQSRFLHSQLDRTEWSTATIKGLALHGSSLDGLRGAAALRDLVIGSDQLLVLAGPVLAALGIVVDDDPDE